MDQTNGRHYADAHIRDAHYPPATAGLINATAEAGLATCWLTPVQTWLLLKCMERELAKTVDLLKYIEGELAGSHPFRN